VENDSPGSRKVFRKLSDIIFKSVYGVIELIQKQLCSSDTALPIPVGCGYSLIQGGRVKSNSPPAHARSRERRRRRASSQGTSATAPLSICCRRWKISSRHVSSTAGSIC
jgi:hypothetical protein